jgi:hypothetical protein
MLQSLIRFSCLHNLVLATCHTDISMWFWTGGAKQGKWVLILLPTCGWFLLWQLAGSLKYHLHTVTGFLRDLLVFKCLKLCPSEHKACSCSLSMNSDSSRVAVFKVTVLILNDTSLSVTDTALNLRSKTVATCLPLVSYKKYEEWHALAQNMQTELQTCPFCYFCMI